MDIMNKLLLKLLLLFSLTFITMQSWALPTCPPTGYFDNCYGTYIHENGDQYVGEWKDDEYHGQGTFYYLAEDKNKGDKYVGQFKNNNSHGQGTYTSSDGDKYVGEWKDNKYHGQGTFYYLAENKNKGDKYVGEWKDDEYHGQGTYYYLAENINKGDKYVGQFKNYNFHGQGTYTWSDGDKYLGEFKDGNSDGFGIHYNADGSIHKQGIWKDDKFQYSENRNLNQNKSVDKKGTNKICSNTDNVVWNNCFGIYSYPKGHDFYGDRYEGMFKNDAWHGQGTYYYGVNDKYIGEFKDGLKNGLGTYYFLAENKNKGDKYVGEWKDSNRHGQGTYTWSDGDKDVGEFKNGNLNGFAISYNAEFINKVYGKTISFSILKRETNQNKSVDKKGTNKICV